jgi:acetoin utilization deacetylase AcuC-like enzyme
VLEGGYHVQGLTKSVKAVLEEMLDETHYSEAKLSASEQNTDDETNRLISQVANKIHPFWKLG